MSREEKTYRIPLFAHKTRGGHPAAFIKQTAKRIYFKDLTDGKHIHVNINHCSHLISQSSSHSTLRSDSKWVDQFHIKNKLGSGEYGDVWFVVRKADNVPFALKIISKVFVNGFPSHLIEELMVFMDLNNHENIVKPVSQHTTFDKKTNTLNIYFLMEKLDTSLGGLLEKNNHKPLTLQSCAQITQGIVQGLAFMHRKGYIHADLSPNNVLIGFTNNQISRVCLTDFSLSRRLNGRSLSTHIVTSWYRSPELFSNHMSFTQSVDLWSVGMIGMECLCGHAIFWSNKEEHVIKRILHITGNPTSNWNRKYGNLQLSVDPRIASTPFKYRLTAAMMPRMPRAMFPQDQEVKIMSNSHHRSYLSLLESCLSIDPVMRPTASDVLRVYYGVVPGFASANTDVAAVNASNVPTPSLKHFESILEHITLDVNQRTASIITPMATLAHDIFELSSAGVPCSAWSLLMLACCTISCKYLIFFRIARTFSADYGELVNTYFGKGVYEVGDVLDAECFAINKSRMTVK